MSAIGATDNRTVVDITKLYCLSVIKLQQMLIGLDQCIEIKRGALRMRETFKISWDVGGKTSKIMGRKRRAIRGIDLMTCGIVASRCK